MQPGWVNIHPRLFEPNSFPSVNEFVLPGGEEIPNENKNALKEQLSERESPSIGEESLKAFLDRHPIDPRQFVSFPKEVPDLLIAKAG